MRDASTEHRPSRSLSIIGIVSVLGWFGFRRKEAGASRTPKESPKPRVVLEGLGTPPVVATSKPEPVMDSLRRDLRYKGLHEDINPSRSVRPAEMTCPNCERQFRYFLNANGTKTAVACPGCGRQYRL